MIRYATVSSPLGKLTLFGDDQGLIAIDLPRSPGAGKKHPDWKEDKKFFRAAENALKDYFTKRKPLPRGLKSPADGTPFQRKVWAAIEKIPYGQTRSYGEIAESIGHPGAARAVGTACGLNAVPLFVPCHRVLAAKGKLGGYTGGLDVKKKLLRLEGAW